VGCCYYWGDAGGILGVAEIVAEHRHAVVRDLNALGYQTRNALIELDEFISIVLASPRDSAVRYAAEGGWSQTDHLLANHAEQLAGLTQLPTRYVRPGVVATPAEPHWVPLTREEYDRRRARDLARGDELAATEQSSTMKRGVKTGV
jgi:hypothetical protein